VTKRSLVRPRALTACLISVSLSFAGCGIFVPEIQEFWAGPGDARTKVTKISSQIECEIREAVLNLIDRDVTFALGGTQVECRGKKSCR
jgi:hypothetical protein